MEQLGSLWTDFLEIRGAFSRESVERIQVSLNSDKNNRYFTWRPIYIFIISRSVLLRMRNSDKSFRENQNTHFIINNFFFFRKSCHVWDNVEKYYRTGEATDVNMAHAHCMLDIWCYKHRIRIRNIYYFSTARVVARTRLNVTLYVHCLSCTTVT